MTVLRTRLFARVGALLCLLISGSSQAQILPKNNLDLEDNLFRTANLTEADFNEVIDEVAKFYEPIVKGHDATLEISRNWTDATVNASASQSGKVWNISMYGGLARRDEVTKDGFALVVCHELGHHLAGFPFKMGRWAAAEGESDYFAAHTCLKEAWTNSVQENALAEATVDSFAKSECDRVHDTKNDREMCYRIANASYSISLLLARLGGRSEIAFDKPDSKEVSSTSVQHPAAQCRLDTMFRGSLCKAPFKRDLIPGKDNPKGKDSLEAEQEAAEQSCTEYSGYKDGLRPGCWFKPNL